MARFEVQQLEGMRFVDIHLDHEMVRCESGAMNYLRGDITVHSQLIPSVGDLVSSMIASESVYRPTYAGTGVITLSSSLGGFHVFELKGESWILEKGSYWASEGSVQLQFFREKLLTSLWAGEGFVYLQTKVSGQGQVAVCTKGPIEEMELADGEQLMVEGNCVIGRTQSVQFQMRRPTKNFWGRFTSGESTVRSYKGPGKVLLNPTFYWRYYMMQQKRLKMP
ncbi:MAG: AIM24 family protein [Planctomycetes bacterium]|nr:AIM24 family protein [Planctomycetota bacterium]